MLLEIRELGFEYAELGHGTRICQLPGIFDAVKAGEIRISSVHNFCPLPLGVQAPSPNVYEFSDTRGYRRAAAVKHTLATIELAARVGAQYVVLHLGSLPIRDYTGRLRKLWPRRATRLPVYARVAKQAWVARRRSAQLFMDLVFEALGPIVRKAEECGIRLGCEIRDGLEELPIESGFAGLFRKLGSESLCYWHDFGHAQIKENMGFVHHQTWLELMKDWLGGFHIHDVVNGLIDHQLPGVGGVDFVGLRQFVKPGHLKVFEFAPGVPADAIKPAVAAIKSVWGD